MTYSTETSLDLYQWTVEDYHRLVEAGILEEDSQVELLNGQIVQMSPVGDLHAACVDKLNELFRDILGKSVIIRVQSPVYLEKYSEPEPDIAILKRKENFYADGHPRPEDVLLIVEVADTSIKKDKELKVPAFANAGIPECWIVNLGKQQIEQYYQPAEGEYQHKHIYSREQILESGLIGTISVEQVLPEFFSS